MESIIESTEIVLEDNASIAGLNNPQREPTKVISLTIVAADFYFNANVYQTLKFTFVPFKTCNVWTC